MASRLLRALAAALLLGGAAGCTTIVYRVDGAFEASRADEFDVGSTRLGEALGALGAPMALGAYGDGVALLWEHVRLEENQLGLGLEIVLGRGLGELFKVSLGSSDTDRVATVLVFDAEGVLAGVGTTGWGERYGRSGSLQFIVAVRGVVDPGTLRLAPRALGWGRELLGPVQRNLNRPHLPAVELLGSTGDIGQHALEW